MVVRKGYAAGETNKTAQKYCTSDWIEFVYTVAIEKFEKKARYT